MLASKTAQSHPAREPLHERGTEKQTVGCRHSNPDLCVKNRMPSVCAFARADGICLALPRSRSKNYKRLVEFWDDNK